MSQKAKNPKLGWNC